MNRRGFIQGFAALAALSVAPGAAAALVQTELDRLIAKMETGLVFNETFYLDGGIILRGMKGLTITQCRFVFSQLGADEPCVEIGEGCDSITITNCVFSIPNGPLHPMRIQDLVVPYVEGPIVLKVVH